MLSGATSRVSYERGRSAHEAQPPRSRGGAHGGGVAGRCRASGAPAAARPVPSPRIKRAASGASARQSFGEPPGVRKSSSRRSRPSRQSRVVRDSLRTWTKRRGGGGNEPGRPKCCWISAAQFRLPDPALPDEVDREISVAQHGTVRGGQEGGGDCVGRNLQHAKHARAARLTQGGRVVGRGGRTKGARGTGSLTTTSVWGTDLPDGSAAMQLAPTRRHSAAIQCE